MNIDELTIGEARQLAGMFSGQSATSTNVITVEVAQGIRIVVLQRGWVVVGRFYRRGDQCFVRNGYVVRKWGTPGEGIGKLAADGPQSGTVLDKTPDIEVHALGIVMSIACDEGKWGAKCSK